MWAGATGQARADSTHMHVGLARLDMVVEIVAELAEGRDAGLGLVVPMPLEEGEGDEAHAIAMLD